jgi:lipopolysaccharide transport system permease protein
MTSADRQEELPCTRLEPAGFFTWFNLRELWEHRELLYFFAWRDIQVRYKQTVLGAAWAVIQPAFLAVIFSFAFGTHASSQATPYVIFVFAGLAVWSCFASSLTMAANSLIDSERLVTKVYFPRIMIPLAAIGPAALDLLVTTVVLSGLMLWWGIFPAATFPLAILGVGTMFLTVVGVGTLLAALNVRYRDFRYTLTFLLQAWMFSTPAIYLTEATPLSGGMGQLLRANPLHGSISFFRAAILGQNLPWESLALSTLVAGLLCLVGAIYFRYVEDSFADVI